MSTKPKSIPAWATGAAAAKIEPLDSIKESGWKYEDAPSSQVVNWWMNAVYQWLKYLEETTDEVPPNLTKIRELLGRHNERLNLIDKLIGTPNSGTIHASALAQEPESLLQIITRLDARQKQLIQELKAANAESEQLHASQSELQKKLGAVDGEFQAHRTGIIATASDLKEEMRILKAAESKTGKLAADTAMGTFLLVQRLKKLGINVETTNNPEPTTTNGPQAESI